jgi:hypothetical protein
VAILFGQYAALKPNAVTANLLNVSNQQFYDVPGRSQLPYQQMNLFAAAHLLKNIILILLLLNTAPPLILAIHLPLLQDFGWILKMEQAISK